MGGYSYSEGLESLISQGLIVDRVTLQAWLSRELQAGSIRMETAVMDRAYQSVIKLDGEENFANDGGGITTGVERLQYWNQWLSAARETEELRQQSWQMGGSLMKLVIELTPEIQDLVSKIELPYNYAIGFGVTARHWQIDRRATIAAYLHSWVTNQIGAGIKLIPLGQTAGQQILWELQELLDLLSANIPTLADEDLYTCSWGLSIASMQHETLYSRLFRS